MANNRYNFSSPGAAAVDELTRVIAEREALRRQAMLDSITQREMNLRESQEARQADYQKKQFEDLAFNREAVRVNNIYDDMIPNEAVDPSTAALLEKHGRGGALRKTAAHQTVTPEQMLALDEQRKAEVAASPTGEADMTDVSVSPTKIPGVIMSRGGTKWLNARQQEQARQETAAAQAQARAEENEKNRAAAKQRDDADRQIKLMMASTNAATRDLGNQLKQLQIDAERTKQETATSERNKTTEAAKSSTQTAYDLASRLLDPTDIGANIGAATGAYELRGFTQGAQDFNAVRDQLIAALALPNLGMLKGPMSDKDVIFVKQLATRLANTRMSEPETKKAILEAQTFLANKGAARPEAAGQAPPPAAASPSPAQPDYRSKYGY